jgi:2-polyprenyl-3-methyl-5-hydroxy-6-metoxy-1,4-benzoquinol methylase
MFTQRSYQKELIDLGPAYYTHAEYIDCLKKLFRVNKFLGIFHDTVRMLRKFNKHATLLDIGCGGGLFILHLAKFFPQMQLRGIDISTVAINEANTALHHQHPKPNISFQCQTQHELMQPQNSVDIILLTLVCHHLTNPELVSFLQEAYATAREAVIINDLHRHSVAYWFYRLISPVLFRNRLITHDGLISIRRGFTRYEWKLLLEQAGIHHYQLKWRFPFRWQLVLYPKLNSSPAPLA